MNKKGFVAFVLATGLIVGSFLYLSRESLPDSRALGEGSTLYQEGPGTVPSHVRDAALSEVVASYGAIDSVSDYASTTLANFVELEPNNARSLTGGDSTTRIYAVMIQGDFKVHGPMTPTGSSVTHYDNGRVITDDSGRVLNVALWLGDKASPPFGIEHDD